MRKLLALLFVVLMVVALAAPVGADDGFVLIEANAARAWFTNDDGCTAEVSYVDAVAVKYFDRNLAMPHSDVDVKLWGTCEEAFWGRNISEGHPDAEIVRLRSAFLHDFEVFNGVSDDYAVADLEWTAVGKPYKEIIHDSGFRSNGRTTDVDVTGTLYVKGIGTFTTADLDWAHITHYTEIVRGNLP